MLTGHVSTTPDYALVARRGDGVAWVVGDGKLSDPRYPAGLKTKAERVIAYARQLGWVSEDGRLWPCRLGGSFVVVPQPESEWEPALRQKIAEDGLMVLGFVPGDEEASAPARAKVGEIIATLVWAMDNRC
jgi:hypothetical protein